MCKGLKFEEKNTMLYNTTVNCSKNKYQLWMDFKVNLKYISWNSLKKINLIGSFRIMFTSKECFQNILGLDLMGIFRLCIQRSLVISYEHKIKVDIYVTSVYTF